METWKDIKDYEGCYQVSNLGRVKSLERTVKRGTNFLPIKERILKSYINTDGYLMVDLRKDGKRKTTRIHRIVGEAFITNLENKPEINHKDGIKINNEPENLEWCTHGENIKHAFKSGLRNNRGENNPRAKLTWKKVKEIRSLKGKFSLRKLGKMYDIDSTVIGDIFNNKLWIEN